MAGTLASEAKTDVILFQPFELSKIENKVLELINQKNDKQ